MKYTYFLKFIKVICYIEMGFFLLGAFLFEKYYLYEFIEIFVHLIDRF